MQNLIGSRFWLSCLGPLVNILTKTSILFGFLIFWPERTRSMLLTFSIFSYSRYSSIAAKTYLRVYYSRTSLMDNCWWFVGGCNVSSMYTTLSSIYGFWLLLWYLQTLLGATRYHPWRGQLWSYDSWNNNYLCSQCISPLTLWDRILHLSRCTRYTSMP